MTVGITVINTVFLFLMLKTPHAQGGTWGVIYLKGTKNQSVYS